MGTRFLRAALLHWRTAPGRPARLHGYGGHCSGEALDPLPSLRNLNLLRCLATWVRTGDSPQQSDSRPMGEVRERGRGFCSEAAELEVENVECVVIGAGVVGLSIARALAKAGREVFVLESEDTFGTGTSSRNSEVIHAGFYYTPGSLKARLCLEGKHALYNYCREHGIGHAKVGKLVVATSQDQVPRLLWLEANGQQNGVEGLSIISGAEARGMEPNVNCVKALHSASTGIVDSHEFMAALQAEAEDSSATFVYGTPVLGIKRTPKGTFHVTAGAWKEDQVPSPCTPSPSMVLDARIVINSAGINAVPLAHHVQGFPQSAIPPRFLARGNYFTLSNWSGPQPFSRLIYPLPEGGGIGIHVTLDLAGAVKFGPDVEWLTKEPDNELYPRLDYNVDEHRGSIFYGEIRKYFPQLPDGSLQADYSGIRPKISAQGNLSADFIIRDEKELGFPGMYNLFGIESPGLTSALAVASYVKALIMNQ